MSEYIVELDGKRSIALGLAFAEEMRGGDFMRGEIVRCKDCMHYDSKRYGCWWFAHAERQPDYSWADEPSDVEPDGFCAWGVRRVGE